MHGGGVRDDRVEIGKVDRERGRPCALAGAFAAWRWSRVRPVATPAKVLERSIRAVADLGEAGSGHEADVARADDAQIVALHKEGAFFHIFRAVDKRRRMVYTGPVDLTGKIAARKARVGVVGLWRGVDTGAGPATFLGSVRDRSQAEDDPSGR